MKLVFSAEYSKMLFSEFLWYETISLFYFFFEFITKETDRNRWFEGFFLLYVCFKQIKVDFQAYFLQLELFIWNEMKYCHLHILKTQFSEQTLIFIRLCLLQLAECTFVPFCQVENYSKASFKVIFICLCILKHSHNLIQKSGREWSLKCNESLIGLIFLAPKIFCRSWDSITMCNW